jgi:hypothetical protein
MKSIVNHSIDRALRLDGSHKSSQHQHHHPSHYPAFYSEMLIQPTDDAANASAPTSDFDNEQQTLEQTLLKLSSPTVRKSESLMTRIDVVLR